MFLKIPSVVFFLNILKHGRASWQLLAYDAAIWGDIFHVLDRILTESAIL